VLLSGAVYTASTPVTDWSSQMAFARKGFKDPVLSAVSV
jgi:hypothetical protein